MAIKYICIQHIGNVAAKEKQV